MTDEASVISAAIDGVVAEAAEGVVAEAVETGVQRGVKEAAKIIQHDSEVLAWQAMTTAGLTELTIAIQEMRLTLDRISSEMGVLRLALAPVAVHQAEPLTTVVVPVAQKPRLEEAVEETPPVGTQPLVPDLSVPVSGGRVGRRWL